MNMQRPPSPSRLSSRRLALALLCVTFSAGACVSTFRLDLPPDHPASASAPTGGGFDVPDPAAVPDRIEAVEPANEMAEMGSDEGHGAMHGHRPKEQR